MRWIAYTLTMLMMMSCISEPRDRSWVPPMPEVVSRVDHPQQTVARLNHSKLQSIPAFDELATLSANALDSNCSLADISYHKSGAHDWHWVVTVNRRHWHQWTPSMLRTSQSRHYAGATIWTDDLDLVVGVHEDYLFFSFSDILVEEGLRQLQNQTDAREWEGQLDEGDALILGDISAWRKENLPQAKLRHWILDGNHTAKMTWHPEIAGAMVISDAEASDVHAQFHGVNPTPFTGWTWLQPRTRYLTWRLVGTASDLSIGESSGRVKALGEAAFRGRYNRDFYAQFIDPQDSSDFQTGHWISSDAVEVSEIPGLKLLPWAKYRHGQWVLSDDTAAFERHLYWNEEPQDSIQGWIRDQSWLWMQSQPAASHMWMILPHSQGWKGVSATMQPNGSLQYNFSAI